LPSAAAWQASVRKTSDTGRSPGELTAVVEQENRSAPLDNELESAARRPRNKLAADHGSRGVADEGDLRDERVSGEMT
jgi:hypothetical protein